MFFLSILLGICSIISKSGQCELAGVLPLSADPLSGTGGRLQPGGACDDSRDDTDGDTMRILICVGGSHHRAADSHHHRHGDHPFTGAPSGSVGDAKDAKDATRKTIITSPHTDDDQGCYDDSSAFPNSNSGSRSRGASLTPCAKFA